MVSETYKQNIYPTPPQRRHTIAEVTYSLTAPDSKDGGELSLPAGNAMSRQHQVMNEIRLQAAPVGTLEPGNWSLDGRFMIPVAPDEQTDLEVGWWSDAISNESGYFDTPLVVERVFDMVQTFNTLAIAFDPGGNNACADFDIDFYDGFNNLMNHVEARGNSDTSYRSPSAGINILRVVITIYRTCKPFRFARILEIDFGLVLTYTDNEIITLSLINEADHNGHSIMYPELNISIRNGGLYDILDPATYAPYFLQRQRFEYRHGLALPDGLVEWVDCGTYHLARWNVSDSRVEFRAVGRTFEIEKTTFLDSTFSEFSIQSLARKVFPQTEIPIHTPPIVGYFGNVNNRRALVYLAELSCCLVYEDRNNRVQFHEIIESGADVTDVLNYQNLISAPEVETSEYYNSILLSEYDTSIEYRQISRTKQRLGAIRIVFSHPVQGVPSYDITPGFKIEDLEWHTMYMTGNLVSNSDSSLPEAEITIHGYSIVLTQSKNLYNAPWHTGREETRPYAVDLPFFIRSTPGYDALKQWFLPRKFEILRQQLKVNVRWRGNPAREVGDFAETIFNRHGSSQGMHVTRTEMRYTGGGLGGYIEVVGKNPLMVRGANDDV